MGIIRCPAPFLRTYSMKEINIRDNVYPEGSTVYAKANPGLQLTVRRYIKRIYYCTQPAGLPQKDLIYYERELTNVPG
ncbi:hypothetical protein CLV24_12745 [Pontibacter ummariensis]|uniref:Uncharacterized protein n=1 Tax=Pontibacter ummariensis TaxID=1610492 RepID=A0A239KFT6_9BACT|nr:hypothetical protein CLV24_12745 [Pontibacter ummariensis]SNT17041.1 hypothetical protein SAMN06296052_12845 [Pontibacter ummariensis]